MIVAVDLTPEAGFGSEALYIIPLLLSTLTGPPRVARLGGWVASALVLLGLLKVPWAVTPWFVFADRAIALAVIWTTASAIVQSRQASLRFEARTRDLADVNRAAARDARK